MQLYVILEFVEALQCTLFWFNGLNLFISKHMFVILEFVEP